MYDLSKLEAYVTGDFTGHGIEIGTKVLVMYKSRYGTGKYRVKVNGEMRDVSEKELEPIII